MAKSEKSPSRSFKNFKFSKNFYSSVKSLIYSGAGIIVGELVFNNYMASGVGALVLNIVARGLEYFFKKYQ